VLVAIGVLQRHLSSARMPATESAALSGAAVAINKLLISLT